MRAPDQNGANEREAEARTAQPLTAEERQAWSPEPGNTIPGAAPQPPRGYVTNGQLENWFMYHAPSGDQTQRYETLRFAGGRLATEIRDSCPPCADTTAAIRKVREAVMTANAAIACGGK